MYKGHTLSFIKVGGLFVDVSIDRKFVTRGHNKDEAFDFAKKVIDEEMEKVSETEERQQDVPVIEENTINIPTVEERTVIERIPGERIENTQSSTVTVQKQNTGDIRHQKTVNIATVDVEVARDYTRERLNEFNMSIGKVLPNFNTNYLLTQSYLVKYSHDIPRYKMPVIEPDDMHEFEKRLETGKIDIFKPYAKGHSFPTEFKSEEERDRWLELGKKDRHEWDDSIPVVIQRISANHLKPLQSQIWLNKVIKFIIQFGLPHPASPVVNTTIIISKENYIIDGHHRWAEVMLSEPSLRMKCLYVPFGIDELLKIGRSYGAAIGNTPNF
ncbi:hypothetical protein CMI37_09295 [Candidatus Pacearchaeota archaeon]|nr:hypothetical protein [Candidatus Pacearchaeota archaeon]